MAVAVRPDVYPDVYPDSIPKADVSFRSRCGRNAVVKNGGKTARRINELKEFCNATVLTNISIKDNQLFEVELVEKIEKWRGSLMIGFTTHAPDKIDFHKDMTDMTNGTWMVSGKEVLHCERTIKKLRCDIRNLVVGQRVGVMRKEGGDMVLFIDGKEVELAAKAVPSNVYGVVDIYGNCVAVKLTSPSVDLNPKHLQQAKNLARQDSVQLKDVEIVKSHDTWRRMKTYFTKFNKSSDSQALQPGLEENEALVMTWITEVKKELRGKIAMLEANLAQEKTAVLQEREKASKLQNELSIMTETNEQTIRQKTKDISHLEEEITHLRNTNRRLQEDNDHRQREVINLQEEVRQLQSRVEQQPKLGTDSDISFWLVGHDEVHTTGQVLGKGGWGSVTVGSFRGKKVAIKELHSSIRSPYYDKLLHREISLMAKVRHPNLLLFIAAVLDMPNRTDPIIVTELLDTDLRKAYQNNQLANDHIRLFILRDVAAALNYLHLQCESIIHRDVSSANVLLQALPDNWWRGKLSDFGSANIAQYASTPGPGNRQYMAPEVLKEEKQSTKMDVYSYGKLFCEVFTSQFPDPQAFPSMLQSMARSWPLMHKMIIRCVEHDPVNRPTMSSIVDQLNVFTQ